MCASKENVCSPDGTFFMRIHRRPKRTTVSSGELWRIRKRSQHSDGAGRMNRRSDFAEGVFRPHSSAPDLGVVEEEELIVA
jgi:hypothetical protein